FWQDVEKIQEERRMPFITTPEYVGHCRGMRRGIESLLKVRFGEEGLKLMPEIHKIYEEEQLEAILKALETATSPDEVQRLWSSGVPSYTQLYQAFWQDMEKIQEERRMPFITTPERVGHCRGLRRAIELLLKGRF